MYGIAYIALASPRLARPRVTRVKLWLVTTPSVSDSASLKADLSPVATRHHRPGHPGDAHGEFYAACRVALIGSGARDQPSTGKRPTPRRMNSGVGGGGRRSLLLLRLLRRLLLRRLLLRRLLLCLLQRLLRLLRMLIRHCLKSGSSVALRLLLRVLPFSGTPKSHAVLMVGSMRTQMHLHTSCLSRAVVQPDGHDNPLQESSQPCAASAIFASLHRQQPWDPRQVVSNWQGKEEKCEEQVSAENQEHWRHQWLEQSRHARRCRMPQIFHRKHVWMPWRWLWIVSPRPWLSP